jgi:hypothetical protein
VIKSPLCRADKLCRFPVGGGNSPTSRGSSLVRPGNTDSKYSRQQILLREDNARMKKQDAAAAQEFSGRQAEWAG